MSRSLVILSLFFGASLLASQVEAKTINLNPPNQSYIGNSYTQDGFTFTNSMGSNQSYGNWIAYGNPQSNADPTGPDIFQNFASTSNTITKVGGGDFDFFGLSLASVYNDGTGGDVNFTFNYASGSIQTATATIASGILGLQAFTFDAKGVSSIVFTPTTTRGPWVQFDYLVVDNLPGVPLPASAPMFGASLLGFAGLGYAANRKKAAVAA